MIGNSLDNRIWGGDGNDLIEGGAGDDTLTGGNGSDQYIYWTKDQSLYFNYEYIDLGEHGSNLGSDRIEEGSNAWTDWLNFKHFDESGIDIDLQTTVNQNVGTNLQIDLSSTSGIEKVTGSAYSDTIFGNARNNSIYGGDGNDNIHGRNGNDFLSGQNGNDTLRGGNGRDSLYGGNHSDQLYSDEFSGDNDGQNDYLSGGSGYDTGDDDGWWYYNPF